MFFILPVGHDQAVYDRPYLTYVIAALCLIVQIWTTVTAQQYAEAASQAAAAFDAEFALDDSARISPAVAAELPAPLAVGLAEAVAEGPDDEAIDEGLDAVALDLARAVRAMPTFLLGYIPAEDRPQALVTYQFAHGGWMHLIGNILFLLVAGGVLECFWRTWAYALLFVLSGVAGALLHGITTSDATMPLVGASGAIAGLMAGFLLGHARTKVHLMVVVWLFVFIRTFRVSIVAMYLIPIWAVIQVWSLMGGDAGGVSYGAHVGGFVAGLVLTVVADKLGFVARDGGWR